MARFLFCCCFTCSEFSRANWIGTELTDNATDRPKEYLADVPFSLTRIPVFYGWIVLLVGTIGVLASAPGQTVGVSVFTDFLIESHHLSRSWISLAYFIGTIGSATLITLAGRWYDRFGGRWVAVVASAMLAVVLVVLSYSVELASGLKPLVSKEHGDYVSFGVLTMSFLCLRFFGQGVLTLSSRNMVMEWFEKRRGLATAVIGISVAFGFSITPRVFEALIQTGGWQWAWRVIAVLVLCFSVGVFVFGRARPEDHGQLPDGSFQESEVGRKVHKETEAGRQFTLSEARRTYSFWVFTGSAMLSGLLLTAFSFHVVSIFEQVQIQRADALAIFVPAAFVSVVIEFVGSWISDFVKLKYLAAIQLLGIILLSLSLSFLGSRMSIICVVLGMGLMQGMFGIVSGGTWPRFFGRRNLGAISGFSTSIVVAGTAVGPVIFSYSLDLLGSYQAAAMLCAGLGLILLVGSCWAERPE